MKISQISVFLENKKGRLYEVCRLFGENGINIRALTIAENDEFGILRMVVNDPEKAIKVLKDNGIVAKQTEIIAVEVEDKPGGLAGILKALEDSNVNVEYMYGFVEKHTDKALMVFRFDNIDEAIKVLTKNNIKIVAKNDVIKL